MIKKISFINIDYGSLTITKLLKSFYLSTIFFFNNNYNLEKKLEKIIKKKFKGDFFFLKNARSSLGFFLKSQGINREDEVIISSFTCLAVPYGVLSCGAKPVYLDINPLTLNFDLSELKKKINKKVKAVVVQHTLGKPSNILEIKKFLNKNKIILIEDCALSIGSKLGNKNLGNYGDASIFSMEVSKTISCGWGGILIVNTKKLSDKVIQKYLVLKREKNYVSFLKNFQIFISVLLLSKNLFFFGKYFYRFFYKYKIFKPSTLPQEKNAIYANNFLERLGRFQIILAIIQWKNIDKIIHKCTENYNKINICLNNLKIKTLPIRSVNQHFVSNRICFLVKHRKKFTDYFEKNGVAVGKWFDGPLSPNPNSTLFNYNKNEFKLAGKISKKIVNLPCNDSLTVSDCEYIVTLLNKYFEYKK
jgi:perosamine synthetase